MTQMNTKRRHKYHTTQIKLLFCVLGFIAAVALSVVGLAQNSQGAADRYYALIAADEAGADVEESLQELRSYIYAHMNSEVGGENGIYPPIQLSGTYNRLLEAENQRVEQTNSQLNQQAIDFCESQGPSGFSGSNRIGCITEYIDANGAQVQPIDDSLYKFDFVAPRWSPDMAGLSMVVAGVFGVTALYQLFSLWRIKHFVRH